MTQYLSIILKCCMACITQYLSQKLSSTSLSCSKQLTWTRLYWKEGTNKTSFKVRWLDNFTSLMSSTWTRKEASKRTDILSLWRQIWNIRWENTNMSWSTRIYNPRCIKKDNFIRGQTSYTCNMSYGRSNSDGFSFGWWKMGW